MLKLKHKSLEVWRASIELVAEVYRVTAKFPSEELYGLTSQLRRASVSVPSNIAEGSARRSTKDRKRFHEIARSSLVEVDTQLEISLVLGFLAQEDAEMLSGRINHVFAMLTRLYETT